LRPERVGKKSVFFFIQLPGTTKLALLDSSREADLLVMSSRKKIELKTPPSPIEKIFSTFVVFWMIIENRRGG
jgi:hypothetical protein